MGLGQVHVLAGDGDGPRAEVLLLVVLLEPPVDAVGLAQVHAVGVAVLAGADEDVDARSAQLLAAGQLVQLRSRHEHDMPGPIDNLSGNRAGGRAVDQVDADGLAKGHGVGSCGVFRAGSADPTTQRVPSVTGEPDGRASPPCILIPPLPLAWA